MIFTADRGHLPDWGNGMKELQNTRIGWLRVMVAVWDEGCGK